MEKVSTLIFDALVALKVCRPRTTTVDSTGTYQEVMEGKLDWSGEIASISPILNLCGRPAAYERIQLSKPGSAAQEVCSFRALSKMWLTRAGREVALKLLEGRLERMAQENKASAVGVQGSAPTT